MAVVMITAPRRGPGYLARSLASLHLELRTHHAEHPVPINVCFSDAEEHSELSSLLPLPSLFILHNSTTSPPPLQKLAQNQGCQIFRSYVFGPSGFWTLAPLCYAAKLDPFLSLDCARVEGVGAQSKERKGSNFAA